MFYLTRCLDGIDRPCELLGLPTEADLGPVRPRPSRSNPEAAIMPWGYVMVRTPASPRLLVMNSRLLTV